MWLLATAAVTSIFAFQSIYPSLIGPISNILPSVCVGWAFAAAVMSVRRYGVAHRTSFELSWLCFALGMGMWLVAESTWASYYFFFGNIVPTYTIADVFYMGGYMPIFAALLFYLRAFGAGLDRTRVAVAALVMVGASVLALAFVFPPMIGQGLGILDMLDNVSFVVLDLTLLALAVVVSTIFARGRLVRWLSVFGAGAILYVVGDELFLIQSANGTYYNGGPDDLIFLLAYLLFAFSFFVHRRYW